VERLSVPDVCQILEKLSSDWAGCTRGSTTARPTDRSAPQASDARRRHLNHSRIIHSGCLDEPFPREYGENDLSVSYSDETILAKKRQFKFAWWHYHTYVIKISRDLSGAVTADISSIGPDEWMGHRSAR